jgi:outer membrane protein TolC
MTVTLQRQRFSSSAALALATVLATGHVLPAQQTSNANLPSAPSSVLAQQEVAEGRAAGSGIVFTAPGKTSGPGGITVELPLNGPLPLSLDDAIAFGLQRNLRIKYDRANQRTVRGDEYSVVNALLPSLSVSGQASAQEINLAALGFKPSLIGEFGLNPSQFPTIIKVTTIGGQINADQRLFDLSAYELYRGARREAAVVDLNALNGRGELVLAVGTAYLKVLADQATLTNAQAEERSSKTLFEQATDRLKAGVGINLDALRAQVEYQQRQQSTIADDAQLAKDTIQLNRIMGLPAGQQLQLTDTAPFAQLADMDLNEAKATAYQHRKDFLSLQAEVDVYARELRAVKYQRLPTLAFNGDYGVIGVPGAVYHGDFTATGSLKFPIFREAAQRGQEQQVSAQITNLQQRVTDLRVAIDSQIRSAMLDVNAANELVKVAQSNVTLAQQELSDVRDRFTAGVDTNLAVVDAQATVTSADSQLVSALYQYNVAKLQLARNTGVVETRYRTYLGK